MFISKGYLFAKGLDFELQFKLGGKSPSQQLNYIFSSNALLMLDFKNAKKTL